MIEMKKSYSVNEFAQTHYQQSIEEVLKYYKAAFEARFNQTPDAWIELEVNFETSAEAIAFYQEIKTNRRYQSLYTVQTNPFQHNTLIVSGKETLFDYLGSKEPNLLTLSRVLGIDFSVRFKQKYSSTQFEGQIVNGELLSRQCLVEYNQVLPELSLGLLSQIGKTSEEFDLLLTRILPQKTEIIL